VTTLITKIRESLIGEQQLIETAFGVKPLIYADYTASGRSLSFIEEFIQHNVLPFYANTHTETSYTGAQTTALREQARQEIRHAVNASDKDAVIFTGSGATSAIQKIIDILSLRLPAGLCDKYPLEDQIPETQRPVVFIGPYEHHSNELPWRESIATLVTIPLTDEGLLDVAVLEEKLQHYSDRRLKIGSFSAASNITGLKTDVDAVTRLLHRFNTLSFWDYAAAGPYVDIDMTGMIDQRGDSSKDAVFISPHKFVGGPGTPGLLVVKRKLLTNRIPSQPAGGTVVYVTPESHRYTQNQERREEGGTPAIVESIRAGLVFKLQRAVGVGEIQQQEESFVERAMARWSKQTNIDILGNTTQPRLAIISLRIKHKDLDLHYGFVVAVLNDLFGIQVRGGCFCAGPYAHSLLDLDKPHSASLETIVSEGETLMRPGGVRLNFNYFIDEETFEYLVSAVELVARYGAKLLPLYNYDTSAGVWRYQNRTTVPANNFAQIDFDSDQHYAESAKNQQPLSHFLALAETVLTQPNFNRETYPLRLSPAAENVRWFVLPQEIDQGG
jgi:selenocysteine lyase/cysteine desulfurase